MAEIVTKTNGSYPSKAAWVAAHGMTGTIDEVIAAAKAEGIEFTRHTLHTTRSGIKHGTYKSVGKGNGGTRDVGSRSPAAAFVVAQPLEMSVDEVIKRAKDKRLKLSRSNVQKIRERMRKAGVAPAPAKPTAMKFVLAHPEMKAKALVTLGASQGFSLTTKQIYQIRMRARKRGDSSPGPAPEANSAATLLEQLAKLSTDEARLAQLGMDIGFARAARVLADCRKVWNSILEKRRS